MGSLCSLKLCVVAIDMVMTSFATRGLDDVLLCQTIILDDRDLLIIWKVSAGAEETGRLNPDFFIAGCHRLLY